jgi:signal transduction histidine kinase
VTRGVGPRLIPLSTLIVGTALAALIAIVGIFAFNAYIAALGRDSDTLLDEALTALAKNVDHRDANVAAHVVAPLLFRPALLIVFTDDDHRVTVFRRNGEPRRAPPMIAVRARNDRSGEPQAAGVFARFVLGSAAISGLQVHRAHVGRIDIYVKDNDVVMTDDMHAYLPVLLLALVVIAFLAFVSGRILNRQALRPLREVTTALERLAIGDFTPRFVFTSSGGELGKLARAYNGAVAAVESAFGERDRANASMRQFIADAGHQLRTPLTVIRGFIAILRANERGAPEEREHGLQVMNQQSLLMGALIENLILLDRWEHDGTVEERSPVDVARLVEDIVAALADAHRERTVRFRAEASASGGTALVRIDPRELMYATTNVVDNALKYTTGEVDVCVSADAQIVRISIADEGPGMSEEIAQHAFDRFSRGERRDVEGSGLGLAIAQRAVHRAGGVIDLSTSVTGGSRILIALPRQ